MFKVVTKQNAVLGCHGDYLHDMFYVITWLQLSVMLCKAFNGNIYIHAIELFFIILPRCESLHKSHKLSIKLHKKCEILEEDGWFKPWLNVTISSWNVNFAIICRFCELKLSWF